MMPQDEEPLACGQVRGAAGGRREVPPRGGHRGHPQAAPPWPLQPHQGEAGQQALTTWRQEEDVEDLPGAEDEVRHRAPLVAAGGVGGEAAVPPLPIYLLLFIIYIFIYLFVYLLIHLFTYIFIFFIYIFICLFV